MQGNDDYDHAVLLHLARPDKALVMDPLGRSGYQGRWVLKEDLRQFASRFTTSTGSPYCATVKRGHQSGVERMRRQVREEVRGLRAELITAKARTATKREHALIEARNGVDALRGTA